MGPRILRTIHLFMEPGQIECSGKQQVILLRAKEIPECFFVSRCYLPDVTRKPYSITNKESFIEPSTSEED